MANDWRGRVRAAGFADVIPHLEPHAASIDLGHVDPSVLHALGLDPADARELMAVLQSVTPTRAAPTVPLATATHAPPTAVPSAASTTANMETLARARVTRALADGDAVAAAAALTAMGTPAEASKRAEHAAWLSGVTLARATIDDFVRAAAAVAHAISVAAGSSGAPDLELTTALHAIEDHARRLERAEQQRQAALRRKVMIGAAAAVVALLVAAGGYFATRSSQFIVGQTGQDSKCGGMFEACQRAKCEIQNVGNSDGSVSVTMKGTIRKYDGAERPVEKDVTLNIAAGQMQVAVFEVPEVEVMETLAFDCVVN
jgi:hypothetical protein